MSNQKTSSVIGIVVTLKLTSGFARTWENAVTTLPTLGHIGYSITLATHAGRLVH